MKFNKTLIAFCFSILILSCANKEKQNQDEWQYLFNGEDLEGWVVKINHHALGDNYANTFRVEDGKLVVSYDNYTSFDNRFGHLFYKTSFSSYHLKVQYHFTEQWMEDAPDYAFRNSGVMFHSQDPKTIEKDQDWPTSIEFQMLADEGDGNPRPTGNVCTPGTAIFLDGVLEEQHCINSSSETFPLDEWVQADLIVYSDSLVIHMINGDTVLQYTKPQLDNGNLLKEGFVALQSEGHGIEFKEVKIKNLE